MPAQAESHFRSTPLDDNQSHYFRVSNMHVSSRQPIAFLSSESIPARVLTHGLVRKTTDVTISYTGPNIHGVLDS